MLGLTLPFPLYGIFRYLYLVHQREGGGSPSEMLLNDRPLLAVRGPLGASPWWSIVYGLADDASGGGSVLTSSPCPSSPFAPTRWTSSRS